MISSTNLAVRWLCATGSQEGGDGREVACSGGLERRLISQLEAGHRVGNYEVVKTIGEGGMGVVYEAEQLQPRRKVALKVVRGGQFVNEQTIKLFARGGQLGLGELTDTGERLRLEYDLLDQTRRQLAARTVLKDTFQTS